MVRLITVGDDTLTGEFRVSDSGTIALPLAGAVHASGLTPNALAVRVTQALIKGNIYTAPSVSVEVTTYRPIFVLGEVAKPGEYPYRPGMTMVTAAAVAGGFTYRAISDYASVVRTRDGIAIEGKASRQTFIQPGDVITSLRAQILIVRRVAVLLTTMMVATAVAEPSGPAPGPLHIVGGPMTGGCIAGAVSLPPDGPGFQTVHRDRSAFWGAPQTIAHLELFGREAAAAGLPTLLIEDISRARGGPLPGGHVSHQIGLDADVGLDMRQRSPLSPAEQETVVLRSMVRGDGRDVDPVCMVAPGHDAAASGRRACRRWTASWSIQRSSSSFAAR